MFGWESEAGAEEGALDATFFSFGLPRLSTPLPGPSSSIPASSHPTELEGDCPHTHSHLASLLTKKKKKIPHYLEPLWEQKHESGREDRWGGAAVGAAQSGPLSPGLIEGCCSDP